MGSSFSCVNINGLSYSAVMGCEANDYFCSGSCNSEVKIFKHKVNSGYIPQSVHKTR